MEGVKKIHDIENEMVGQIRTLYQTAFPPIFGYTVEYFFGEEEGTQRGVLVYSVTSKFLGDVYCKQMRLPDHVIRDEVEPDFLGKVLTDFIMLGTSFITNNIMASNASKANDVDGILVKPFSQGRLKNINPN